MGSVLTEEDNLLIAGIENAISKADHNGYKRGVFDAVRLLRAYGQVSLSDVVMEKLIKE